MQCTQKFETVAQNLIIESSSSSSSNFNKQPTIKDKIVEMSSSNLLTVIRLSSGSLYWWGILPYEQRVKCIDKYQSKLQKIKISNQSQSLNSINNNNINDFAVGSFVCLKSVPVFNAGSLAICIKDSCAPCIGQLAEHVFHIKENRPYRFKIKSNYKRLSPTQLPSAKTQTTTTKTTTTDVNINETSLSKRKNVETVEETDKIEDENEHTWYLSEVIFVEDKKSANILGKIVKVDMDFVLVKIKENNDDNNEGNKYDVLENTRIFAKSQLQVLKNSTSQNTVLAKFPDFNQKNLKKLGDFGGDVLSIFSKMNTIHAIVRRETYIFYVQYDLFLNKLLKEKKIPTNSLQFSGINVNNISIFGIDANMRDSNNCKNNHPILTDGNATLYPLLDMPGVAHQLKEAQWKQTFPIKCFAQHLISTKENDSKQKNNLISIFVVKIQQLITSILRCDINRVSKIIKQLDDDLNTITNPLNTTSILTKKVKRILLERMDGSRNIIHAAVFSCAPKTNNNNKNTNSVMNQKINLGQIDTDSFSSSLTNNIQSFSSSSSSKYFFI